MGGDFPLVTKEGHNVLDLIFTSPIQNLGTFLHSSIDLYILPDLIFCLELLDFHATEVADSLYQVVGVVEHGVISRIPSVPTASLFLFRDEALICDIYISLLICYILSLSTSHFFNKTADSDNYQLTKAY